MSAYQCPECGGSFPRPAARDDDKPQCPWCGEVGQLEMRVEREILRMVEDRDSNENSGIFGDGLLEKLR